MLIAETTGVIPNEAERPSKFWQRQFSMQRLLKFIIRPRTEMADSSCLILPLIGGGGAGALLAQKISLGVGLPFALFATLVLHLTWRTPNCKL